MRFRGNRSDERARSGESWRGRGCDRNGMARESELRISRSRKSGLGFRPMALSPQKPTDSGYGYGYGHGHGHGCDLKKL